MVVKPSLLLLLLCVWWNGAARAQLGEGAPTPNGLVAPRDSASDKRFFWCAGQGGYGFQTACAASRVLAEVAAGRESDLAGALSPRRLRGAPPPA